MDHHGHKLNTSMAPPILGTLKEQARNKDGQLVHVSEIAWETFCLSTLVLIHIII